MATAEPIGWDIVPNITPVNIDGVGELSILGIILVTSQTTNPIRIIPQNTS